MNRTEFAAIIRHILTTIGGAVVARGIASEDDVTLVVGAVSTLAGVAWSIWQKRRAQSSTPPVNPPAQ